MTRQPGTGLLRVGALAALLVALAAPSVYADMELTAPDGRRVLLRDDQTWAWVDDEAGAPPDHLLLEIVSRLPQSSACRYGLRMTNNLGYALRTIVPQFSTYKAGGVRYETVFVEFSSLKPTDSQYREITFRGIRCEEVESLRMSGGDRCSMGELNRYSGTPGECLSHVKLAPSTVVDISK